MLSDDVATGQCCGGAGPSECDPLRIFAVEPLGNGNQLQLEFLRDTSRDVQSDHSGDFALQPLRARVRAVTQRFW